MSNGFECLDELIQSVSNIKNMNSFFYITDILNLDVLSR